MVYKTEADAAAHIANAIVNSRTSSVSVQITFCPENIDEFANLMFEHHPELISCIDSLSMRFKCLGAWNELILDITYTDTMVSSVVVFNQVDSVSEIMLRDVKLHRRVTEMVFPNELEESAKTVVSQITRIPQFLDCFIKGTEISVKRRTGSHHLAISVRYLYTCSYSDYKLRKQQMKQAIDNIVHLSRRTGIEDWKKAFSAVKFCVENWTYGNVDEMPEIEYYSYGALVKHKAVCKGISLAVCAIFSELGIPCRYIRGLRNASRKN